MQRINQTFRTVVHTQAKIIGMVLFVITMLGVWFLAPSAIPVAQAQSSTLYTQFTAQNLDASTVMNVRVKYSDTNGSPVLTTTHTVNPYRSVTINQPSQVGLATNFNGSAVFDVDKPFGLVVNEYNGTVSALGKNFLYDGYTGVTTPVTDTVLPQILKNHYDPGTGLTFNNRLAIENTNTGQNANVTITYRKSTGEVYTHSGIVIAPGGWYAVDTQNDSALAGVSTFYGSGRILSSQPVAVVVNQNTANSLSIYPGLSSVNASTTLYVPQLLKNCYDPGSNYTWNSGVLVMSLDGTTANVTITYKSSDGAIVRTESAAANPMGGFDLRYSSALSGLSTFYGTGTLTSDKPIVAFATGFTNYDATRGMRQGTYRAFPSSLGGKSVFLPTLSKNAIDATTGVSWSTGVIGQLIGTTATTVTITYYLTNGATFTQSASVTPSAPMFGFDQRSFASLPEGSIVSGVLTTNPSQSIVAVTSYAAGASAYGDAGMYYEGIGQP